MLKRSGNGLLGIAAAIALGSVAASAHAALYTGTWDPTYGAPYPTALGWKGTATYNVPLSPPCNTSGTACAPGAYVQDAHVEFYDTGSLTTLATIDWTAGELGTSYAITSLAFAGNDVQYVASDPLPYKAPTCVVGCSSATYGYFDQDDFSLEFVIGYYFLVTELVAPEVVGFSGPLLYWKQGSCEGDCGSGVNDFGNYPPQNFIITQVPEPASLALVMAGLLAAGASARRVRSASGCQRAGA